MINQIVKQGRGSLYPPFNPMVWLDGADSNSMTISTTISQWRDKSRNNFHATQGTSGLQPSLLSNTLNGKSVVHFDGTRGMSISSVPLSAFIIFIVFRSSSIDTLVYEHSANSNTANGSYIGTSIGQTTVIRRIAGAGNISAKDLTLGWGSGNTWKVVAQIFDGTNIGHNLYINNSKQILTTNFSVDGGLATVTDSLFIASRNNASLFLTGDYAEILIYNTNLSYDKINNIYSYLNNKWRIF